MKTEQKDMCPKCGAQLNKVEETLSGRKLQRCSNGKWNAEKHQVEGCSFARWLPLEPKVLDEKCPECGLLLVMKVTRLGRRLKACSGGSWNAKEKKAIGCTYVEWIHGTTDKLDEKCPHCSKPVVLYTTAGGRKLKKCSSAKWDREQRQAVGCSYTHWLVT